MNKAILGGLGAAGLTLLAPHGECASDSRPNVLMVLIDDTDLSMINAYQRGANYLTPELDRLGEQSVRFSNAHVVSTVCTPSRYVFQTGRFAGRCRAEFFRRNNPLTEPYSLHFDVRMEKDSPTLARALRQAGYYTGFSGKWHIGSHDKELGLPPFRPDDNPLDPEVEARLRLYQETFVDEIRQTAGYEYVASVFTGNANCWFFPKAVQYHNMEWMTRGALDFFDSWDREKPFFFSFCPTVFHGPGFAESLKADIRQTQEGRRNDLEDVQAPRETIYTRLRQAGMPEEHGHFAYLWMDDSLKAITDKLKALGVYDNTVVIFAADHGNYPHKATCYDGGSRSPLMIRWPGHLEGNVETDLLASSVDVVPTVLDICGVDAPAAMPLDGKSLVPALTGRQERVNDAVYIEFGYSRAVFDGQFKYISVRFPDRMIEEMKSGKRTFAPTLMEQKHALQAVAYYGHPTLLDPDQLYHVPGDPKEQKNLAANPEYAQALQKLKKRLHSYTFTFDHPFPAEADPFMFTDEYRKLAEQTKKEMPLPDWYNTGK